MDSYALAGAELKTCSAAGCYCVVRGRGWSARGARSTPEIVAESLVVSRARSSCSRICVHCKQAVFARSVIVPF